MNEFFKCESLTHSRYDGDDDHFVMPSLTSPITDFQDGSSFPEVLSVFDFGELVSSSGSAMGEALPDDPFSTSLNAVLDETSHRKLPPITQLISKRGREEINPSPSGPQLKKVRLDEGRAPALDLRDLDCRQTEPRTETLAIDPRVADNRVLDNRITDVFQIDEALSPLSSADSHHHEGLGLSVAAAHVNMAASSFEPQVCASNATESEEGEEASFLHFLPPHEEKIKPQQPEQSYVCQICHKTFTRHCNVIKHKRINHGIMRDYPCKQCFLSFPAKEGLDNHIRERHTAQKERFSCGQCGATFAAKFNLNKHVRNVHEKKRPFKCPDCDSTFQQKDHLNKHIQTVHEKRRPHSCDHCTMSFGWRGVLNKHIQLVHNRERPFCCSICGQNFQQKAHLDKHNKSCHDPVQLL